MDQTGQFYFSVELLTKIISDFATGPLPGTTLKGFVFMPGYDTERNPCIFPFPLYSKKARGGSDGDVLVQNTDVTTSGCPYPPPCSDKMDKASCYQS